MSGSILIEKDNSIEFHLKNKLFDGPLDLLLQLINRAEIEIKDIFVSEITQQYLDLVNQMDHKDCEYEADFIAMAAKLIRIKSAALLPRTEYDDYYEEEEGLISDLEQYEYQNNLFKILQEGADKLREKEILYRFYREPQFTEKDYKVVISKFSVDAMISAFSDILDKMEHTEQLTKTRTIEKEVITIEECRVKIYNILRKKNEVLFSTLFQESSSKLEVIGMFLALLDLLKKQVAESVQSQAYGDITIKYTGVVIDTEEGSSNVEEYN